MSGTSRDAIRQYRRVDVQGAVEGATPHRLIQMMMEGALARIAAASGLMERGDTAGKGANISLAISILQGLRGSLDLAGGGQLAANLDGLYDYMVRRLVEANAENDRGRLEEVQALVLEVKAGWDAIADEAAEAATTDS